MALQAREFYLLPEGQDDREAYLELMTETVTLLGADPALARAEMAQVMFFETQLANVNYILKILLPLYLSLTTSLKWRL